MTEMAGYLAGKIKAARDSSGIAAAQAKYRAAFVRTTVYSAYKEDVDTILVLDGYEDCIVTA
jgi:hypothetical protein